MNKEKWEKLDNKKWKEEQAAELWFMSEQADSTTLTWVTITTDKVIYETFQGEDKTDE